ncbi:MAG: IPT/TIG domain-containing protein [Deltaproteobacteria bacterium]|nr:IPT/TIG domain-containing protein [Deltaproteobacteria bacterium]
MRRAPPPSCRSFGAALAVLALLVLGCGAEKLGAHADGDGDGDGDGDPDGGFRPGDPGAAAILFTDLTSGPVTGGEDDLGVFVTIFGEGFGAERGTSKVTIGGVEVARYVIWGQDNAPARNLDAIVVQPGPEVVSGDLVVTKEGKSSNPLRFTVRSGTIYFVEEGAPNASDANPGTRAEPFATLQRPASDLAAGDVVFVKGGTFDASDPWATGWDCILCVFPDNHPAATADAPVAYVGYPGEPPVLGAPQPVRRALRVDGAMTGYVFANLHFTHYGGMVELAGRGHRFVGNSLYDGIASYAIGIAGNTEELEILGNLLRDNGEPGDKMNGVGLYLQGFGINRNIDFGWNQIQDQHGSRPVQAFGHQGGDIVDEVRIHDNLLSGSELNLIVLGGSDGGTNILGTILVYNNILVGADDPGLRVNEPAGTVLIQNNVLYDNGSPGLNGSRAQIWLERTGRITLQGNILYAQTDQDYLQLGDVPVDQLAADHNLVFNSGADGCAGWDPSCIDADPLFVDVASGDFRLDASSPAVDSGADTGIGRDYAGTSRPQGAAFDVGAYERVAE